jgi:hypothetical protein
MQVWKAEKEARSWNALVKEGEKYRLEKKRKNFSNVATPWISEDKVVKSIPVHFKALQRYLAGASEKMDPQMFEATIGYPLKDHNKQHRDKQVSSSLAGLRDSSVTPFTISTFLAIELGSENNIGELSKQLLNAVGDGDFAKLQEQIANNTITEQDIEILRDRISDEISAFLGPLSFLLFDIPGLSYIEDKTADYILGEEVEALRESFANYELDGDTFENACESP